MTRRASSYRLSNGVVAVRPVEEAAHGVMFLAPPPDIAALMNASLPRWFQLFLGVAEVAAAVGLILPGITRVLPSMIGWAVVGIMVVMISATLYHAVRGEISSAIITAILLVMAGYVAYARWWRYPIAPRRTARSAMA